MAELKPNGTTLKKDTVLITQVLSITLPSGKRDSKQSTVLTDTVHTHSYGLAEYEAGSAQIKYDPQLHAVLQTAFAAGESAAWLVTYVDGTTAEWEGPMTECKPGQIDPTGMYTVLDIGMGCKSTLVITAAEGE